LPQVFIRVFRLEIQSVMLIFSTQNCNLLSGSTLNPPPFPCVKVQYIQTVCGWEGVGGIDSCWRPILQKFKTLYLARFRTYKLLDQPKQNSRRGDIWYCFLSV
jgi:hypothetical protein